jgi:alpha-galactosidase
MSEIRYIEGLYALWDGLRERHPGLWIDNCASGGRRIDLETLSRALPLWPSDFSDVIGLSSGLDLHVGDQCLNAGLARWTPLFGGGVWNFSPYGVRGQVTGGFTLGFHIEHSDFPAVDSSENVPYNEVLARGVTLLDERFPLEQARAAISEWKSIRPYILGDLHLLFPVTAESQDWAGWQFHRADLNAGIGLIFRRHASPYGQADIKLNWINPQAVYEVSLSPGFEPAPAMQLSGAALAQLSLTIAEKPASLLMRYRKL